VAVLGALAAYRIANPRKAAAPLQSMSVERFTNTGEVWRAALSPDAKYVAYTTGALGSTSLRVRQVAARSDIQVLPPGVYRGLTFSRDGNYIYYVEREANSEKGQLLRVPTLGGQPQMVAGDVNSPVTFSPDGRQFAFVRGNESQTTTLLVAAADGSGERTLVDRHVPESLSAGGPAWSPDGKTIAVGAAVGGKYFVMLAPATGGPMKPLGNQAWLNIGRVAWLPESRGVILVASESRGPGQHWELSYPDGQARRITNDLSDYADFSLAANSADPAVLAAVAEEVSSNVWTAPQGKAGLATQVTVGAGAQEGFYGLAWTPDARILFDSLAGGSREIWIMNADGSHPRQLTSDVNLQFYSTPSICPDGRTIVFAAAADSANLWMTRIWTIDADGGKPKALTGAGPSGLPVCSPDGKWVVYTAGPGGKMTLWKVPISGGGGQPLTNYPSGNPAVSPDGKWIAFMDAADPNHYKLGVVSFDGDPTTRRSFEMSFSQPYNLVIRWAAGGTAVDYLDIRNGVSNIWRQSIEGGPPRPITEFHSGLIFNFAWSPDGKTLAVARGSRTRDVLLIRNFEGER
jgi:Tol biopolymer transport system component